MLSIALRITIRVANFAFSIVFLGEVVLGNTHPYRADLNRIFLEGSYLHRFNLHLDEVLAPLASLLWRGVVIVVHL